MPDRDGIRADFRGPWRNCVKFASEPPSIMAQALHSTITSAVEGSMAEGTRILKPLRDQLIAASELPSEQRERQNFRPPPGTRHDRACQAAARAAQQTLADVVDDAGNPRGAKAITERLVENYSIGLSRMQFLDIFVGVGIPAYFKNAEESWLYRQEVEAELRARLSTTVCELADSLDDPKVTRVKMPKKVKRPEEQILRDEVHIKLDAL